MRQVVVDFKKLFRGSGEGAAEASADAYGSSLLDCVTPSRAAAQEPNGIPPPITMSEPAA